MNITPHRRVRRAFSLLELVLALGLSLVLLVLIGFAIDQHYYRLEAGRAAIEQSSIARAVLERIAADIRSVTSAPPQDVDEQMQQAEDAALFDVDEVDEEMEDEAGTDDAEIELDPPGVNGTITELRIDLPRVVQAISESPLGPHEAPVARVESQWSHVRYYVVATGETTGLYRFEAPRDEVLWAQEQGAPLPPASQLASEVVALRLRYFDGQTFYEEWDQYELGALPRAIEVVVELVDTTAPTSTASDASNLASPTQAIPTRPYRRLVLLPSSYEENDSSGAGSGENLDAMLGEGA